MSPKRTRELSWSGYSHWELSQPGPWRKRESEQTSPFQSLSDELIELVFQFLPRRDFARVGNVQKGLAKHLIQMRFLDLAVLNTFSDKELLAMPHGELHAMWMEHVEPQVGMLCGKSKKDFERSVYEWSHKAATGFWGGEAVSPQERLFCCERIIFLLLHSHDDAVRKDAMLALIRVAREMQGDGDLEKQLVWESVGRVVGFVSEAGGLEAVEGIAKIVFESIKRPDTSGIAKEVLLGALNASLQPVADELARLVSQRVHLRESAAVALKDNADAQSLKDVERALEEHAVLIAEVDRLNHEKGSLWRGMNDPAMERLSESSVECRLKEAHARLASLQEASVEIAALIDKRNELQVSVWNGAADEAQEQELSFINKRLDALKEKRDELDRLRDDVAQCKRCLSLLKIEERLDELSGSIDLIHGLKQKKWDLEEAINASDCAQELSDVDTRIATLNAFVQGFIHWVSTHLALEKLSGDSEQDAFLRNMLVESVYLLCSSNPENEKTFKQFGLLLEDMICLNAEVTAGECLRFKEYLLKLEKLYASPERVQAVNIWLFHIGTSGLNFQGEVSVEDDAMGVWLDRITDEDGSLAEPFPLARIGRLAKALSSNYIKLESRWRIFEILKPHLESIASEGVHSAEVLHILHSFASSVIGLLYEVSDEVDEFDFQRALFIFVDALTSMIPEDWEAAWAVLKSIESDVSNCVRVALKASVS